MRYKIGNVILHDGHHTAADSLYAALLICGIARHRGAQLDELAASMTKYPQMCASVHPMRASAQEALSPLESIASLQQLKAESVWMLGEGSRVLMWYSSTEPGLLKTMVEGTDSSSPEQVRSVARATCHAAQSALGSTQNEMTVVDLSPRADRVGAA